MKIPQNISKISSWTVFAISLIVYFITASRSVNFWDCAELIACASGLQIAHPPGAPFYLILARSFEILSFGIISPAFAINLLSAFAAAFTVFFTYKSIQLLANRILIRNETLNTQYNDVEKHLFSCIAGIIGALSLAFSITFWASATETEVYSVSILLTSVNFWLILKYYTDKPENKNRLLILSALILGISTAVHLLNILVIPALVFVWYFEKNEFSKKSFFITLFMSVIMLAFVQLLISGLPVIASVFELFFVNNLGLGFNSGLYIFSIFIISLMIGGIYFSGIKKKISLNLVFTCLSVFIIGYSTYTTVIIRSYANTPIDQNNPETIFNFISYINREQYGDRPLWYGQMYNTPLDKEKPYIKGEAVYDKNVNKYEIVSYKPEANYNNAGKVILPRMWSNLPAHIVAYQEWTGSRKDKTPGFVTNMSFMLRYQLSHMYLRYFMWNFTGRQNDIQSHGGPMHGNWISGIGFIDNIRLTQTKDLPPALKNNKGRNAYYFLPLILGILGIIVQFKNDKKFLFVISLLFVFTGIAIAFYLNQHPYQARERDYSFIGSFYAFSLWIGLGSVGLLSVLIRFVKHKYLSIAVFSFCFIAVPGQFLAKNFNDRNISRNDFARSFAYNLLNSCEKNAILFVSGDNETFPLWYLQEVENVRTDVRVVNLSFLNTDWYIDQIICQQRESAPINLNVEKVQYISGQRELMLVKDNPYAFLEDIYYNNLSEINQDYAVVFDKFDMLLIEAGFDKKRPQEYQNFYNFYQKIQPHGANEAFRDFCTIVFSLESPEQCEEFGIAHYKALDLIKLLRTYLDKQLKYPIPLNQALNFVFSDDAATKINTKLFDYPVDYFPASNLCFPINANQTKEFFFNANILDEQIVKQMTWNLNRESITKSELMLMEIIRSSLMQRPIYFSSLTNSRNYMGLEKYLYLEGFAYRLIPIDTDISADDPVNVNAINMYDNFTNKFVWGNVLTNPGYLDETGRTSLINLRNHYSRLSRGLYFEGEIKKSEEVLDYCIKLIPNELIPFDYYTVGLVHAYYRINKKAKAGEIAIITAENALSELEFYAKFPRTKTKPIKIYQQRALKTIEEIYILADKYSHKEFLPNIDKIYQKAVKLYVE
jgi:hypothetical protein